ncbi:TPA: MarR family transcriptional regulator [Candidatus Bipolaricaulota bacterium]|nr:MarR family transcriptional regulator [Candidatus Bipolaricaulota bacterium]
MEGVKAKVLKALEELGKPARPGEIAQAAGLPKDEVSKALKELKREGKVNSPKRCFYAPAG